MNRSIELHTCRQHHKMLRFLIEQFPVSLPLEAKNANDLLHRLSAILSRHLRLEDERLYPALQHSRATRVRDTALRYQHAMGGLSDAFVQFCRRWPDEQSIDAEPHDFLLGWLAIRDPLLARMDAEDSELYAEAQTYFDDLMKNADAT